MPKFGGENTLDFKCPKYTLFDGLACNKRGYRASCAVLTGNEQNFRSYYIKTVQWGVHYSTLVSFSSLLSYNFQNLMRSYLSIVPIA